MHVFARFILQTRLFWAILGTTDTSHQGGHADVHISATGDSYRVQHAQLHTTVHHHRACTMCTKDVDLPRPHEHSIGFTLDPQTLNPKIRSPFQFQSQSRSALHLLLPNPHRDALHHAYAHASTLPTGVLLPPITPHTRHTRACHVACMGTLAPCSCMAWEVALHAPHTPMHGGALKRGVHACPVLSKPPNA